MNQFDNKLYRILAVDDELTVLGLYEQILSPPTAMNDSSSKQTKMADKTLMGELAFDVTCCNQGDQAVEAVKLSLKEGSPFAVAFLDLHMPPGPDGHWTAEQIQKLDPGINVILVTGYYDTPLGIAPVKSELTDQQLYLQKPFHRQEIIQFATALSTKWQAERELRKLHSEMESLIEERTEELLQANRQLKIEVENRRTAQKALHMSEMNFRNMIRNNADGILIFDKNSIVQFMNPAAENIFGMRAEQLVGQTFDHLVVPGKPIELDLISGDGKSVTAEMRVMNTEWEGEPAYLASLRDITERKLMQLELQNNLDDLKQAVNGTIKAIALTVEIRDPYTSGHQHRVAHLARAIAGEIELSGDQAEGVYTAAAIHDIGKISLPAEILSKPVKLTDIEIQMIQAHSQVGYDILKGIDFPWPIARIVLQHHERMDGSGYPNGLVGEEILLEARILGVADVVETMASHRPYRPSMGIDKALEEVSQNKTVLYDPRVVDACLRLFTDKGFEFPSL
ncbi:MAG: HD domain-containing protein [Desulfobacterales bacterium]|nr:MAG: HD domain-containing protein [Desulfobacterales bacterium]